VHEITLDSRLVLAPGLSVHTFGDDVLIVGGTGGAVAMSGATAIMWQCIEAGDPLALIATDLAAATGVDPGIMADRILEFARELEQRGLLAGPPPPPAAPTNDIPPPVAVPEIGRELPDSTFTVQGGGVVEVTELRGARAVFVGWDPGCAHCAEIESALLDRREALTAAGVALVLVDGRDASTFASTGTPTAFLVDPAGRLERPMAAGTWELLRLVDELVGDTDLAAPTPGIEYPPAAAAMCTPGDPRSVQRSVWAGTRAYLVDGCHVGVKVATAETGAIVDRLFPGARVDDRYVPVHYAVELHADGLDDSASATPRNVLVHGGSELVRSHSAARVLSALLAHLTDDLGIADSSACRIAAAALVRDGRAVVVPWATRHWSRSLEPMVAERGFVFVDGPAPGIDLDRGEIVVAAPSVPHDPEVLAELDRTAHLGAELARVMPGRYPIAAWCFFGSGASGRVLSVASATALALPIIGTSENVDALVDQLSCGFEQVPAFALAYETEREFVDSLPAL
jgi:hypothetical protein